MTSKDSRVRPRDLEKKLKYRFRKAAFLTRALTHKSYANEQKLPAFDHNERLEFLGDAVLDLVVSEMLMARFQDFSEGDLSKLRAAIVNERKLAELARQIDLGAYLYLGRGEEQTDGRRKESLLADAFEAILGAAYLDRGHKKAGELIRRFYEPLIKERPTEAFYEDYKTRLQERCQSRFRAVPRYRLIAEEGPDHEKIFEVQLSVKDQVMGSGRGRSKKEAEQSAAKAALERLEEEDGLSGRTAESG